MAIRLQSTRLQNNVGLVNTRLETWVVNPWRKLSFQLIAVLIGFLVGSVITSVAGVLGQMDPVVALIVVLGCELTVRLRRSRTKRGPIPVVVQLLDLSRIGFLYGLFLEAFKLI